MKSSKATISIFDRQVELVIPSWFSWYYSVPDEREQGGGCKCKSHIFAVY